MAGPSPPSPNTRARRHGSAAAASSSIGLSSGRFRKLFPSSSHYPRITALRRRYTRRAHSALAVIGFLCTNEAGQDIQLVISGVSAAMNYGPAYKSAMASSLEQTEVAADAALDATNIDGRLVRGRVCWKRLRSTLRSDDLNAAHRDSDAVRFWACLHDVAPDCGAERRYRCHFGRSAAGATRVSVLIAESNKCDWYSHTY